MWDVVKGTDVSHTAQGLAAGKIGAAICLAGACLSVSAPALAQELHGLTVLLQKPGAVADEQRAVLLPFYAERNYQPLWLDWDRHTPRSAALLTVLDQAAAEGLRAADYAPGAVCDEVHGRVREPVSCELRLSDALLRYAHDVNVGVVSPAVADPHWHIQRGPFAGDTLLDAVADTQGLDTLLAGLPPPQADYRALRRALAEFRRHSEQTVWPMIPAGAVLRRSDRGPRVRLLRQRLLAEDAASVGASAEFDAALEAAVKRFQARHGLLQDGVVGRRTLAAINVSAEDRETQILLNLERWRWLPRDMEQHRLQVNLAGFELSLVDADQPLLRLRTINGRRDRSSPAFRSRITGIDINPSWTVPRRLAIEDLLPLLQQNAWALDAKQIEVLTPLASGLQPVDPRSIDWQRYDEDNFPFVLRQRPGPRNSLGRIKFLMPNPYTIFLHDTPEKWLFQRDVRAYSSGCVRVDEALNLAARIFPGEFGEVRRKLDALVATGETQRMILEFPMPVYLLYQTAWVDTDGNLQFRDDVYGRNIPLRDYFGFR